MRAWLQRTLFGGVLILAIAGCQTAPAGALTAPPPLPPGGADRISAVDAAAGRALYLNKCARCHKFYDPSKYNEADWGKWMTKMSRKAKLKAPQAELLGRYLEIYRPASGSNSPAPAAAKR